MTIGLGEEEWNEAVEEEKEDKKYREWKAKEPERIAAMEADVEAFIDEVTKEADAICQERERERLAELERIRLAEIAAEEARLEAIAQAERDRLAEIARKEKARLDAIAQAQADALGLPSLQQIMEKATVSAVNADSFVSLRLSPRGLRVGFPLLEPPPPARSWSAPAWARPIAPTGPLRIFYLL